MLIWGQILYSKATLLLQVDILTCEGTYCGAHGYLHGRNTGTFLGEPASNKEVRLR